jgi:uroporphyrinogen-III synthase
MATPKSKLCVAITRASDDAVETARRLAAGGFTCVTAPVLRVLRTDAPRPEGAIDAIVATSVNAIDALSARDVEALAQRPLHVVGARVADRARAAGFRSVANVAPNAAALAPLVLASLAPRARVLYLAGVDRGRLLEEALAAGGHAVTPWLLYEARARAWSARECAAVADSDAMLHYSPRSAALALANARAGGIPEAFAGMRHICISAPAAAALAGSAARDVVIADSPDEAGLIAALRAPT